MRDRAVRRWCKSRDVPFIEYEQTGVTRRLTARDDFSKKLKAFLSKPLHNTTQTRTFNTVLDIRKRLVVLTDLPGSIVSKYKLDVMALFTEIPQVHRKDRPGRRQHGGETKAMATLDSFLRDRGSKYSSGISSPNSAWTSCSRLSPYLTWGHISLRFAVQTVQTRQEMLRTGKRRGQDCGPWLRSLQGFSSRLHWRPHFIQKLESEPLLEKRDLCAAYQPLRRQEGDHNSTYYRAWESGNTGFPFVDACMRCLLEHGWLNFRMRAMLVSFATYNLWLDWKFIAPHLARVFLDYEPGIHYPQLQMQSGTTGINAMRVYNVTKQGKDQDQYGKFIRRYIPELAKVSNDFIHEPWKMPRSVQHRCEVVIGSNNNDKASFDTIKCDWSRYPKPIVDEQESARTAKAKVAAIKKLGSTKAIADEVYQKHGSRNLQQRDKMEGSRNPKALSTSVLTIEDSCQQPKITAMFAARSQPSIGDDDGKQRYPKITDSKFATTQQSFNRKRSFTKNSKDVIPVEKRLRVSSTPQTISSDWNCHACTLINDKPHGLLCSLCGTPRTNNG